MAPWRESRAGEGDRGEGGAVSRRKKGGRGGGEAAGLRPTRQGEERKGLVGPKCHRKEEKQFPFKFSTRKSFLFKLKIRK